MTIQPTPWTAAAAGAVAAAVWPLLWGQFGKASDEGGMELIAATLLVIALPAHAFVVGFGASARPAGRTLDTGLLKRIGVWLAAAGAVTALRSAWGL